MKKSVFLATSFTKKQKVEKAITKFFEDKGFEVKTGRLMRSGKGLAEELFRIIESCDFGIVVYNELRHNISYEWGLLDAILGQEGHVFLFKDANIHINLDYEISDKKGTVFTPFCGEDSEKEIIKSLEENRGLMDMIETCLEATISNNVTVEVSDVASAIASANIPLVKLQAESPELKLRPNINAEDLDDLRDLEIKFEQVKDLTIEGHFYKSSTHFYAGDYEKAEFEMRNVIELDKGNALAYDNLGVILSKLGKHQEAEIALTEAVSLDPGVPQIRSNFGIILSILGRDADAISEMENAIILDPDNADLHALLGSLLLKVGKYSEAEAELRLALNINPNIAMAHGSLGLLYGQTKNYEEAEIEFREEIRLDPGNSDAHVNLGRLLAQLGRYEEAEREFIISLSLDPNNAIAYGSYGLLLTRMKNFDGAQDKFKEALDLDNSNVVILSDFTDFLVNSERFDEAESACRSFVSLYPDNAIAHSNLGYTLFKLGRLDEAEVEYRNAIKLDDVHISTYINLGALLVQDGRYEEAETEYLIGFKMDPDDPNLLINLAELYLISSNYVRSYEIAENGFNKAERKDKIIFKLLMLINQLLIGKKPDKQEFINFLERNKGYKVTFEFETLKESFKKSEYYSDIVDLTKIIIKYSS